MSPFRKITQQLGALDLKSPDLEDFATPMGPAPDLWPQIKAGAKLAHQQMSTHTNLKSKSPSATDITAIASIQKSVNSYNMKCRIRPLDIMADRKSMPLQASNDMMSCSLPVHLGLNEDAAGAKLRFSETHFDVNGDVLSATETANGETREESDNNDEVTASACSTPAKPRFELGNEEDDAEAVHNNNQYLESKNEILQNSSEFDENGMAVQNCSIVLGHNGAFLDTKMMSSSPSANYYRPTEEPEPLDLTQLNIEASVMCLVSKVKFLCGRCGSPAVRLRQPKQTMKRGFNQFPPVSLELFVHRSVHFHEPYIFLQDVVTNQPKNNTNNESDISSALATATSPTVATHGIGLMTTSSEFGITKACNLSSKDLNLALTQAVGEVTRKVKKGNKFTDGLDLSLTTDWASELRPSMRKLRQAMDGLLKTARLMHSVQRLQQDMKRTSATLATMYRRDVCFSQAVSCCSHYIRDRNTHNSILLFFVSVNSTGVRTDGKTLGNADYAELYSSALWPRTVSLFRRTFVVVRQRDRYVG